MNIAWRALWLFGVFMISQPLAAADDIGRVVGVSDGEKQQIKVRLGEIDTPESKQPYGERAKQALSDLAYNRQTRVVVQDTDRAARWGGSMSETWM